MSLNLAKQFEKNLLHGEPERLRALRADAWNRFQKLGFPAPAQEDWRYTSLKPLTELNFELASLSTPSSFFQRSTHKSIQLVFVNGIYAPHLSSSNPLPSGVEIQSLCSALQSNAHAIFSLLDSTADPAQPFLALNTAFLRDGAWIRVAKGVRLTQPIELIYYSHATTLPTFSNPRNLIVLEEGSEVSVIENYEGERGKPYWTNAFTEVLLQENARFSHYKIQQEESDAFHLGALHARQARNSQFLSCVISLGARLARHGVSTVLEEEGAECTLNGLYLTSGEQHVDNQTKIDHASPHCTSQELYKGILDGKSQGVFNGKIIVQPKSAKTLARQSNKNLLLSNDAVINTKPLLEIYNNDVKCNHGATIGRLDENQLFYLRSRGLEREFAKQILTYAFASDLIEPIPFPPLKARLQQLLFKKLIQAPLQEAL